MRPHDGLPAARAGVLGSMLGALAALALLAGCSRPDGPPRVRLGEPCAACGMAVQDARFACVRRDPDRDRTYDSIECLIRGADLPPGTSVAGSGIFLADYDDGTLRPAGSVWVVKGNFPSPMGGGLAAFASFESAREVMERTGGRMGRLEEIAPAAVEERSAHARKAAG